MNYNIDYFIFSKPIYKDNRGFFIEKFNVTTNNFKFDIKQVSTSFSKKYTFRGFHFEVYNKMNKIVHVKDGHVVFFLLDLRLKKPSIHKIEIKSANKKDDELKFLYVPWYYAIGFLTFKKSTVEYFHDSNRSINNRSINIKSFKNLKTFYKKIKHISKNDFNAQSWKEWKKNMNETKFFNRNLDMLKRCLNTAQKL